MKSTLTALIYVSYSNNNNHFICQKKEIELKHKKNDWDGQKTSQNSNKLNGLSSGKKTNYLK